MKTPPAARGRWDRDPPVSSLGGFGFSWDSVGKARQPPSSEIKNSNDQMCSQGSGDVIEKRYRQG